MPVRTIYQFQLRRVTFWAVLEHQKLRFSQVHNPTQCPIHDKGPEPEALLPLIVTELSELAKVGDSKAVARRKKLVGQLREVRAQAALYRQAAPGPV